MAIIGIDLGTTNSLAAVWKDGKSVLIPNALGELLTPSTVSVDDDGTILVGKVARERLISHPRLSVSSFKRLMGTTRKCTLGRYEFLPEELSSFVLRRLKEDAESFLGETVTEAVISVPAYFNDNQRSATKVAAQLAGLHTERLVNEPSAAALACRIVARESDQSFLVFDLGGGTLDVSVVDCFDNIIEIAAVAGDNHLGGNDFDLAIARSFCQANGMEFDQLSVGRQAVLLKQAEVCKQALSRQSQVAMLLEEETGSQALLLNNHLLVEATASLFQRMQQVVARALADSGRTAVDIDQVLLVGGSCHMPAVRSYVGHIMGKAPDRIASPDTVVAIGVGAYGGIKSRSGDIQDMMMTDVCPFTLGVASYNDAKDNQPHIAAMIERNSVLPVSVEDEFFTLSDNQKKITVAIYQGEEYYAKDNLKLGELTVPVAPAPKGHEKVQVRFTYDINGILEVEVSSKSTNQRERAVIVGERLSYSQEEIDARLAQLQTLKIHPKDQEENRLVLAWGERLYTQTLGRRRELVGEYLSYFQQALESHSPAHILRAKNRVEHFLEEIEGMLTDGISMDYEDIRPNEEDEEDVL